MMSSDIYTTCSSHLNIAHLVAMVKLNLLYKFIYKNLHEEQFVERYCRPSVRVNLYETEPQSLLFVLIHLFLSEKYQK